MSTAENKYCYNLIHTDLWPQELVAVDAPARQLMDAVVEDVRNQAMQ